MAKGIIESISGKTIKLKDDEATYTVPTKDGHTLNDVPCVLADLKNGDEVRIQETNGQAVRIAAKRKDHSKPAVKYTPLR